jgi:hypothetical protein
MKRSNPKSRLPQHDYGLALQSAVSWLGDRYLLAEPVSRRAETYKPFFAATKSWHDSRTDIGPRKREH